jgi:uncharacterized lipoprotein YajG
MRKELVLVAGLTSICVTSGFFAGCQSGRQSTQITDPNAAFSRSATNSNTTQESGAAGGRRGRGSRGAGSSVGADY